MFYPAWRMYDFMTVFTRQNTAFISDSRDTTRPMTNGVLTLSQISNSFDNVAYDKCKNSILFKKTMINFYFFFNSWMCFKNVPKCFG